MAATGVVTGTGAAADGGGALAAAARRGPGERERLAATLVLSLIVHTLIVLGIGFVRDDAAPAAPTLDVILSQTRTPLTPEQADFLAQANQQGGGDSERSRRPRDTQLGRVPSPEPGLAPQPLQAQAPPPAPAPEARVIASPHGEAAVPPPQPHPETVEPPPQPRGEARIRRDAEMARLAAEVHLRSELYAKRPTRKFISASTREYAYAQYLRAWVDRAERVGNLNYPDEARQRRLGGQVVISVAIRRDGSVEDNRVLVSSGVPLLDSSALRIVRLAEPFPPLPQTQEDVDILHVTRTWVFLPEGGLRDD